MIIDPLVFQLMLKFFVAMLCATAIGLERNYKNKPAGVRTCNLICSGTVLFVTLGALLSGGDPTRVMATLIQGIGFIGGGAILVKNGLVEGLTTASVIWILTAIGCAIGFGYFQVALFSTAFVGFILFCAGKLEDTVKNWMHD